MNAIPSKPAYPCPLRDETLVLIETCEKCAHNSDFSEYYLPREGGVVYCDYRFFNQGGELEYYALRNQLQDKVLKEMHHDEATRQRVLNHSKEHGEKCL